MTQVPDDFKLTAVSEAATRLGVSRERLVRRIQSGRVQGVKIGDHYFVPVAVLERLAAGAAET